MTDDPSLPERSLSTATQRTETYRVEAHNRIDEADAPDRVCFDFRLTRTDRTPSGEGAVLELLASHLAAAAHSVTGPLDEPPRVGRVVVDGTVVTEVSETTSLGSAIASVDATVHAETPADDASVERWRRVLRDHDATQSSVPTDTRLSLAVERVPR